MAARKPVPANQTRGYRQIQSFPITQDNQQLQVDLPRGPHIESAIIRVGGTINNSVAWAGGLRNGGPFHFARNLQWVINSNVTLDSLSGFQTNMLLFTRRGVPGGTNPATGIGATSFEATYFLDRSIMDMARPKDSYLKTDYGMSANQLRIQMGAIGDMFQAGAGASTYTNVTASVHVVDYQEARNQKGDTPSPLFLAKKTGQRVTLPAAGANQQIKISTGNRLRAIALRVLVTATGEPDLTLLSRVSLRRAGDTRIDMNVTDLFRNNSAVYGSALNTGQIVIDLANPGYLGVKYSEFWPLPSSADTSLVVETTASCILEIVTIEGVDLVDA